MGEFRRPSIGLKNEDLEQTQPYFKRPSIGLKNGDLEQMLPYYKRPSIGVYHDDTFALSMTAIIDNRTGVMITSRYE